MTRTAWTAALLLLLAAPAVAQDLPTPPQTPAAAPPPPGTRIKDLRHNDDDGAPWTWPVTASLEILRLRDHDVRVEYAADGPGWLAGVVALDPSNNRWYSNTFQQRQRLAERMDLAATGSRSITKLAKGRIKGFDISPGDTVGLYLLQPERQERSEIVWAVWQ